MKKISLKTLKSKMMGVDNSRIKSALLLLAAILLIITSSIWGAVDPGSKWLPLLYTILFCAGGYVLSSGGRWLIAYLLLSIPGIVLPVFSDSFFLSVVNLTCLTGAFMLLFRAVLNHAVFRQDVHHIDRLLAGIAGYILLGIFWSTQFGWVTLFDLAAFMNMATSEVATRSELLYFSFITLTTVGFGDIAPVTPLARIPVIFNSLSGVLYLAIFISSLVGNFQNQGKRG